MPLLAVWGAVVSLVAAMAEGIALLPRPGLPFVGEVSPIGALPVAALIALEIAVLVGVLQNGGSAVTLDQWNRLVDKDNYDYVYDYDYGQPYRKLFYFASSAPDDSASYYESEEEGEEGGGHRKVSQYAVPPFSHYQPASYDAPHTQGAYPPPTHGQGPYASPQRHPNRRYSRSLKGQTSETKLLKLAKEVEGLQVEKDEKVMQERVQDITGRVLRLDEDGCLLKLLCHLQEKPQDARDPQDNVMLSLFPLNAPGRTPACGEVSRCPVEETQLEEAFTYTWQLHNTV